MELNWLLRTRQEFATWEGCETTCLGVSPVPRACQCSRSSWAPPGREPPSQPPPAEPCLCIPNQQRWAAAAPRACARTLPVALASAEEGAEHKGLLV